MNSLSSLCLVALCVTVNAQTTLDWTEPAATDSMFTTYQMTGPSTNTDSCFFTAQAQATTLDELSQCWKTAYDKYWQDAKKTKFPMYEPRCTGQESYPGGWIGSQIRRVLGAFTGPIEPKSAVGEGDCAAVCDDSSAIKVEFTLKEAVIHSCALKQVN